MRGELLISPRISNSPPTGDLQRDPITPSGPTQSLFLESILASSGRLKAIASEHSLLPPATAADPASGKGTGPLDSAAKEELEREALAKFLGPVAESMRRQEGATHAAAALARPAGSRGIFLFWLVIALSAGAIIAALATK